MNHASPSSSIAFFAKRLERSQSTSSTGTVAIGQCGSNQRHQRIGHEHFAWQRAFDASQLQSASPAPQRLAGNGQTKKLHKTTTRNHAVAKRRQLVAWVGLRLHASPHIMSERQQTLSCAVKLLMQRNQRVEQLKQQLADTERRLVLKTNRVEELCQSMLEVRRNLLCQECRQRFDAQWGFD